MSDDEARGRPSVDTGSARDPVTLAAPGGPDDPGGPGRPATPARPDVPPPPPRSSRGGFFRELPFLVLVAFGLALLIKAFLVQAFFIPSGSMRETLEVQDRVLVNKLVYEVRDIRRGEVVVFDGEGSFSPDVDQLVPAEPTNPVARVLRSVGSAVGLGAGEEKDFIKRVIGLPGDRVACCTDGQVTVQAEGGEPVPLDEPYVFENDSPLEFCEAGSGAGCSAGAPGVLVPEGRVFVLGDHRCCSSDSRLHLEQDNGTIPVDKVIGRAFVVVWPLDRTAILRVPEVFDPMAGSAVVATPYALGLVGALPLAALRRRRRSAA